MILNAAEKAQISILNMYANCKETGLYSAEIRSRHSQIGLANFEDRGVGAGAMYLAGKGNYIGNLVASGAGSSGRGLLVEGSRNRITANIYGFTEGVGLYTNNSASGVHNTVKAKVENCGTIWENGLPGVANDYKVEYWKTEDQVAQAGSPLDESNRIDFYTTTG